MVTVKRYIRNPALPPKVIICDRCGVKVVCKPHGGGKTKYCVTCRDVIHIEHKGKQAKRQRERIRLDTSPLNMKVGSYE